MYTEGGLALSLNEFIRTMDERGYHVRRMFGHLRNEENEKLKTNLNCCDAL